VKYRLYDNSGNKSIVDSATVPLTNYGTNEGNRILQSFIRLKVPVGKKYPLEVRFRDENKDLNVVQFYEVDKRENFNDQYFKLRHGKKILVEAINSEKELTIEKSPLISADTFLLEGSKQHYKMTPPPFAEKNAGEPVFIKDQENLIVFNNQELKLSPKFTVNRISLPGSKQYFYFYQYPSAYPKLVSVDQLVQPIRYISTSSEFKRLTSAVDYKKAVDAFWLKLGKEEERTRQMIEQYYSRVEQSNRYFSSYKEGWKTDRGIIYIVYGLPSTIYKTAQKETWIYGEENNILSVKFEFIRKESPWSNNEYELVRSADFKNNWYRAVDGWRQAKIF
jgi:GWxTD domain-containing protein